jgi:hypothetical protein
MWSPDRIAVEIVDADHPVLEVVITTPIGAMNLVASASIVGRVLRLDGVHVDGLAPGALGRAGLNAIGYKLLEVADVEEIIIQGGTRTTGKHKGKVPSAIRFPHPARPRAR